jgi:dCMP deaminase
MRSVGAVISPADKPGLLVTGHNGAPEGLPHCLDAGCIEEEHDGNVRCARSIHAEANALMHCARHGQKTAGATLYSTCRPCRDCTELIIRAGIRRVVHIGDVAEPAIADRLKQANAELVHVTWVNLA